MPRVCYGLHRDTGYASFFMQEMREWMRGVVIELEPVKTISYDGGKLTEAIVREGVDTL